MSAAAGVDELVRGAVGLIVFGVLFLAARYRFTDRERRRGPGDVGLD